MQSAGQAVAHIMQATQRIASIEVKHFARVEGRSNYTIRRLIRLWLNLATTARRLHDRNWSGWWAIAVFAVNRLSYLYYGLFLGLSFGVDISIARELLLVMIAVALGVLQTWIIIELFFLAGTDGPNRFGPDPTRAMRQSHIGSRPEPAGVPDFLVCRVSNSPR